MCNYSVETSRAELCVKGCGSSVEGIDNFVPDRRDIRTFSLFTSVSFALFRCDPHWTSGPPSSRPFLFDLIPFHKQVVRDERAVNSILL